METGLFDQQRWSKIFQETCVDTRNQTTWFLYITKKMGKVVATWFGNNKNNMNRKTTNKPGDIQLSILMLFKIVVINMKI